MFRGVHRVVWDCAFGANLVGVNLRDECGCHSAAVNLVGSLSMVEGILDQEIRRQSQRQLLWKVALLCWEVMGCSPIFECG